MTKAKYKASGAEWIERLPEHWDEKPAFSVFDELDDKNELGRVQNVLSLSYGKIVRRDVDSNFGLLPESFSTYQIVRAGDIVLRLLDLQNDHVSLRVGLVPEEGIVTSAYLAVRPKNRLDSRFAAYLLHAYDIKKVFYSFGGGCRQSMGFEDLRRLPIPLPSPAEQRRIADYLDAATGKIDRLVAMRRRQMELLQEQRAALIQQAVTRGLNPNAPLKDSGIPWLGKIPNHWEVKRIKYIARFVQTGSTPPSANVDFYDENGLNWYGPGDFSGALKLGTSARRISELAVREGYADAYEPPLILIVGIGASVGKIGFADQRCFTNQQVNAVGLCSNHSAFFFANFLASFSDIIASSANHATLPIFNQTQTRNFPVVVPPRPEQLKIEKHIQQVDERFSGLLSAYARQIEMLGEYRAALIHEAVTGQRLVPEALADRAGNDP